MGYRTKSYCGWRVDGMVTAMKYLEIPTANLRISQITLGTVEFGMEYGLNTPGKTTRPSRKEVEEIISTALEQGINLFDTAPGYGESEYLIGDILRRSRNAEVYVATKVGPFHSNQIDKNTVLKSLDSSLRRLQRDRLDLVQIHNASTEQLLHSPLMETLIRAREEGKIGAIGASTYGEKNALAALAHKDIDTLQIAYNLLDQRMAERVLPEAAKQGIILLKRSAFLKGALTPRRKYLPVQLKKLKTVAEMAARWAAQNNLELSEAALRFCLAAETSCSTLIGVSSSQELIAALATYKNGPLSDELQLEAKKLALSDEKLIDPRFWDTKQ